MEDLIKKLKELKELLEKGMNNAGLGGTGSVKAGKVLPSISKLPKPGNNSLAGKVKIPNVAPVSQKDPIKSIEQTQNKDIKDLKMKEAQAHFSKDEDGPKPRALNEGPMYHIHQGSLRVTSRPLSLKEINDKHSGIKAVEAAGYRVIPHKETITVKKNGQWELDDMEKSGYKGYTPEDNARRKANNIDDTGIQAAPRVKAYGGNGPSAASREAAQLKAKSKKNPVKVYTPAEIAALQDKKD